MPFNQLFRPAALLAFWGAITLTLWLTMAPTIPAAPGNDKLHHAATFGALTFLGWVAYSRIGTGRRMTLLLAFGALIEVLQGVLPFGRSADLLDLVADAAGISITTLIVLWARRLLGSSVQR